MTVTDEQGQWFAETFRSLCDNVELAVLGKRHAVELAFTAMLSEGHLLLEDVPGTGKTSLARAMAQTVRGTSTRIQFTPDLLPGDVTGIEGCSGAGAVSHPRRSRSRVKRAFSSRNRCSSLDKDTTSARTGRTTRPFFTQSSSPRPGATVSGGHQGTLRRLGRPPQPPPRPRQPPGPDLRAVHVRRNPETAGLL